MKDVLGVETAEEYFRQPLLDKVLTARHKYIVDHVYAPRYLLIHSQIVLVKPYYVGQLLGIAVYAHHQVKEDILYLTERNLLGVDDEKNM